MMEEVESKYTKTLDTIKEIGAFILWGWILWLAAKVLLSLACLATYWACHMAGKLGCLILIIIGIVLLILPI